MRVSPENTLSGVRPQFLEGVAPRHRKSILAAAAQRRFFANSVVFNQGDSAHRMYLLTEGSARYFYGTPRGEKLLLTWVLPGEIFGAAALLSRPTSYLVSLEIVKDSSVLTWDRGSIRGLVVRHPVLLDNALSIISDYMNWFVAAHTSLACHSARQKLAHKLVELARLIGRNTPSGVELDVTNEELANAAHVTAFTASRLLSEWQRRGVLKKNRGRIKLQSPEQLFLREA